MIAKVFVHLGFHHLFDGSAQQIFERILDVLGRFDFILLKELLEDVSLSIGHLNFVYSFFLLP